MVSNIRIGLIAIVLNALSASGCAFFELYPPGPVTHNFIESSCFASQPTPACNVNDDLTKAIHCATETRNNFGTFLRCREDRQIAAGTTIAALAAGAAGVAAAGISTVAAVSLGATAGAGIGLEIATYNKPKTEAYSDAIVRLQCVIGESEPLGGKLSTLPDVDNQQCYVDVEANLRQLKYCEERHGLDTSRVNLVGAKFGLAKKREIATSNRLLLMNSDVVESVQTIDVRAFAQSQSGVPDADQIQKGAEAVNSAMPSLPKSAPAPRTAGAAAAPPTCFPVPPDCNFSIASTDAILNYAALLTEDLNRRVAAIPLPEPGFKECLAIKAYESSSPATKSSILKPKAKPSTGQGGGAAAPGGSAATSPGGSDAAPSDGSNPTPKPEKIAFQVLPSDFILLEKGKTQTIKLIGGLAPYFWIDVDDDLYVTQASQTDLFVSLELKWSRDFGMHRLLVADQAGAQEIVYVNLQPTPKPPAKPTKPCKPCKPPGVRPHHQRRQPMGKS